MNVLNNTKYWLERIKPNDLVIIDSPYDSINNSCNRYGFLFDKQCQEKLYIFINKLNQKGVKLICFNGNTPFIKDLYKNYNQDIINSYSNISRRNKTELIIYN